ncbi:MAG TPA: hydroxyisourate hydrolase [Pyrinomonadaceae bacterium]|nr:hydroxyisourate hydrolase [Pyrinomonadaceae bacterium]
MSTITTHILDISRGRPASSVQVSLEMQNNADGSWRALSEAWTDEDGRVKVFILPGTNLDVGIYRLIFDVGAYFSALGIKCFYPQVSVAFKIEDAAQHYHIPLLLSPFGYSTYRGS